MESFTKLFGSLLVFVYHCFDRIVINGYLEHLARPGQVVHFFREILGVRAITKEALSKRTEEYRRWVEAYSRNQKIPMQWAEKGVRKEDFVRPYLKKMEKQNRFGVCFIFQSMEQGTTFPVHSAQVSNRRPGLPDPGAAAQPVHALLFLHPG